MKPSCFSKKLVLSHPRDNVATAIAPIGAGTPFGLSGSGKTNVKEDIPFGHKVALRKITTGSPVIKYGENIGRAARAIEPGELVHVHNVESAWVRTKEK